MASLMTEFNKIDERLTMNSASSNGLGSSKKLKLYYTGEDRISSLHDSILLHILSFLPTKYSVGTSILSKRWKHLWAAVENLDFDHGIFFSPSKYSLTHKSLSFMTFIDRVLLNHGCLSLQKFRLVWGRKSNFSRVYKWIRAVIGRGVQEVDIFINLASFPDCYFPPSLFTSPTLVSLKLQHGRLHFPEIIYLPSLKILHVATRLDNELMQNIISNCPLLEELFIDGEISDKKDTTFDVSSPALRIFNGRFHAESSIIPQSKIVINAPILRDLTLNDAYLPCYLLRNLNLLVKADVDIGSWLRPNNSEAQEQANRIFALLREISSVKYLSLGVKVMEALNYGNDHYLPLFSNLTRLELSANTCHGWEILPVLLNSMPNLLVLVLKKSECGSSRASVENFNLETEALPTCLSLCLQEIEVTGLRGLKDELKLVEYFLRNAQVLQKMAINSCYSAEEETIRGFHKKLLMIPRVSESCKIEIAWRDFKGVF